MSSSTKKAKNNHKQQHLFPIISTFLVIGLLILVTQVSINFTSQIVLIAAAIYWVSNIAYAMHEKSLTLMRFIELTAVTVLVAYASLQYLT